MDRPKLTRVNKRGNNAETVARKIPFYCLGTWTRVHQFILNSLNSCFNFLVRHRGLLLVYILIFIRLRLAFTLTMYMHGEKTRSGFSPGVIEDDLSKLFICKP